MTKDQLLNLIDEYAQKYLDGYVEAHADFHTPARAKVVAALEGVSSVHTQDLMTAAKLALDALYAVLHDCDDIDTVQSNEPGRFEGPWQLSNEAIEALKKAGVK